MNRPLTRREWLLSLSALACTAVGCRSAGLAAKGTTPYVELAQAGSQGRERVVVFLPDTEQTREVWRSLSDELSRDFRLIAVETRSAADADVIAEGIARHAPAALVLMNNTTLAAYGDYQRARHGATFPPAVAVMSSFLEGQGRGIASLTGISYEVPLITVVTNLRKLIVSPVERIGVLHREALSDFVGRQAKLAAPEQISVVREQVTSAPNASEIKRALRQLKRQVDALWVLNDDRLLTEYLIRDGWVPGMNERPWVPVIVGAASLVSAEAAFGTFAVLPDHIALGLQAADLIFELSRRGWQPPEARVQEPLSTTTTIDLAHAEARFRLKTQALTQVDNIVR
jgi:ABC-type uncharacterized transport system substrate-binding protein